MLSVQLESQKFQIDLLSSGDELVERCDFTETTGLLLTEAGVEIGRCVVHRYRRSAGMPRIDIEDILFELDVHSDQAAALALLFEESHKARQLERYVNHSGLLLLESMELTKEWRGKALWKPLLQATLDKATEGMRKLPDGFFLKASPLNQQDMSSDAIRLAEGKLEALYKSQLGASRIVEHDDCGIWMFAPLAAR